MSALSLSSLPTEILRIILDYVIDSTQQLTLVRQVCHQWEDISSYSELWRELRAQTLSYRHISPYLEYNVDKMCLASEPKEISTWCVDTVKECMDITKKKEERNQRMSRLLEVECYLVNSILAFSLLSIGTIFNGLILIFFIYNLFGIAFFATKRNRMIYCLLSFPLFFTLYFGYYHLPRNEEEEICLHITPITYVITPTWAYFRYVLPTSDHKHPWKKDLLGFIRYLSLLVSCDIPFLRYKGIFKLDPSGGRYLQLGIFSIFIFIFHFGVPSSRKILQTPTLVRQKVLRDFLILALILAHLFSAAAAGTVVTETETTLITQSLVLISLFFHYQENVLRNMFAQRREVILLNQESSSSILDDLSADLLYGISLYLLPLVLEYAC